MIEIIIIRLVVIIMISIKMILVIIIVIIIIIIINDNNDKNNDNDNDNNSIDNKDFDNYEIFTNIMHLYVRTDGIPREINAEELKKQILRVRNVLYHAQTGCL